mgnify:CR=1 FL=1
MPAVFTLSALNCAFNMDLSALFDGTDGVDISYSAEGRLYFRTSDMKKLFRFQTDASSVGELNLEDTQYFIDQSQCETMFATSSQSADVDAPAKKVINVVHSSLQEVKDINDANTYASASDTNQNLLRADFVRYLAYSTTGSVHGTDLFDNENELLTDLGSKGHSLFFTDILQAFNNAGTKENPLTDASNGEANMSRVIMSQMKNSTPERFANVVDTVADQAVPFLDGDILNFKLTINPHPDTKNITEMTQTVQSRVYKISIELVADNVAGTTGYDNHTPTLVSADGNTVSNYTTHLNQSYYTFEEVQLIYLWRLIGSDIMPDYIAHYEEYSTFESGSMSSDGTRVAVGERYTYDSVAGEDTGVTRVYENSNGVWTQLGGDIIMAEAKSDNESVLSSDGTTVAIGCPRSSYRMTRVYRYDASKTVEVTDPNSSDFGPIGWTRLGNDLESENVVQSSGEAFGSVISMSSNGNIIGFGDEKERNIRIYQYRQYTQTDSDNDLYHYGSFIQDETQTKMIVVTNTAPIVDEYYWLQLGDDINGDDISGGRPGVGVSLSSDGTILAATNNLSHFGYGPNEGDPAYLRNIPIGFVFQYSNNNWSQLGNAIDGDISYSYVNGELEFDNSRTGDRKICLSSDGHRFAVSHPDNGEIGVVKVYDYDSNADTWTQLGGSLISQSYEPTKVFLSADGTTVAIGYGDETDGGTQVNPNSKTIVYRYDSSKTSAVTDENDSDFGPIGWRILGNVSTTDDNKLRNVNLSTDGNILFDLHEEDGRVSELLSFSEPEPEPEPEP